MKIQIKLKDAFSGCIDTKVKTYKIEQKEQFKNDYKSLQAKVGTFWNQYDKKQGINYNWEIVNISLI